MKTNADLLQAAKLVLLYSKLDADTRELYLKMLQAYASYFKIYTAKSIRFEGDMTKIGSVMTANSKAIDTVTPDETPAKVVEYYVRTETQPRYAFFSEQFTESFSVRFFEDTKKLNKLLHNSKITVQDSFTFDGCMIVRYTSENSKVKRFAICAHEIDFADPKLEQALLTSVTNEESSVEEIAKTSFFGG